MKKTCCLVLVLLMVVPLCFSASAQEEYKPQLSELSDEELLEFQTTYCVRERYISLGNGTHIGKCNECGEYIGNAITCTYSYRYSNADMHTRTCSGCVETSRVACVYVNNVCRYCGHYKISGSIIQSLRELEE